MDLEVAVIAGGASGRAGLGDGLTLIDLVAHIDQKAGVVAVVGLTAVAVVDDDQFAVSALPAGVDDRSAVGGGNGGAVGDSDVNAPVEAVRTKDGAVAVAGSDVAVSGPDKIRAAAGWCWRVSPPPRRPPASSTPQ